MDHGSKLGRGSDHDADKGDPFKYQYCSPDSLRKQAARPAGVDLLGYVHDKGPLE